MIDRRDESGFTLIETLVVVVLLSVVLIAIYQVMFSSVRSADTTQVLVDVSEEARAGFNRLVRDTREAERIIAADADGETFTVEIDFDGDGVTDSTERFSYDDSTNRVMLTDVDSGESDVLMEGVIPVADGVPIFEFSSNLLEWDDDLDGVTSYVEVDAVGNGGNGNGVVAGSELFYLTNVTFNIQVESEDGEIVRASDFIAEAQLRNARGVVD